MKLSYRDKVIFICVIVVAILLAGFFIFIKPAAANADTAKIALEAKQEEQKTVQDKIDTLPTLIETLKNSADEIGDLQKDFVVDTIPINNEHMLTDILHENEVEILEMNTTYTYAGTATEYMVNPENILSYDLQMNSDIYHELPEVIYNDYNGVPFPAPQTVIMGITDVTVKYRDSYDMENVLAFVDEIAEDKRSFKLLTLSNQEDTDSEPTCDGEITLRIYSLNPMNVDKVKEETEETALEEAKAQYEASAPSAESTDVGE